MAYDVTLGDGTVRGPELDSVILLDPFQLCIFCDCDFTGLGTWPEWQ